MTIKTKFFRLFITAFILSAVICGTCFAEEPETHEHKAMYLRFEKMNIMMCDYNGSFREDEFMKRSEAAKIVTRCLTPTVEYPQRTSGFSDVPFSHWASGYIEALRLRGVVSGNGDKTFLPEEYITYEQFAAMLVRSLGYTKRAAEYGTYPENYITLLSELGISDGIEFKNDEPVKRGIAAIMTDRALDAPLMEIINYRTQEYGVLNGTNGNPYMSLYIRYLIHNQK